MPSRSLQQSFSRIIYLHLQLILLHSLILYRCAAFFQVIPARMDRKLRATTEDNEAFTPPPSTTAGELQSMGRLEWKMRVKDSENSDKPRLKAAAWNPVPKWRTSQMNYKGDLPCTGFPMFGAHKWLGGAFCESNGCFYGVRIYEHWYFDLPGMILLYQQYSLLSLFFRSPCRFRRTALMS